MLKSLFPTLAGAILFLITAGYLITRSANQLTHKPKETVTEQEQLWNPNNSEIDQVVAELRKERAELDAEKAELRALKERLENERAELNQITQRVHQVQIEFDKRVVQIQAEEAGNLKKLAKMYSTMEPEIAAKIFNELEDHVTVKILSLMKQEEIAALLENLARKGAAEAKRAAEISEKLRMISQAKVVKK